jgi:hypothetical protein
MTLGAPAPAPAPTPVPETAAGWRVVSIAEFYGANRIDGPGDRAEGLHAFLVEDANTKAAASGADDVVEAFTALEGRLRSLLASAPPERLVPVVQVRGGVARLDDYLVTRVIELVVHADDLVASVGGGELEVPVPLARVVVHAFADLAVARSGAVPVLRAFARAERATADALRVL